MACHGVGILAHSPPSPPPLPWALSGPRPLGPRVPRGRGGCDSWRLEGPWGEARPLAGAYGRSGMAKEFRGRAVFLKVDVNRNHAASSRYSVRSMPTFVVFAGGKERTRFSGADERRLRMEADKYARQAKSRGTYVGVEVTPELLRAFYVKHGDEAKAKEAGQIARKYRGKTLRLMSSLRKKYGDVPETKKKGSLN